MHHERNQCEHGKSSTYRLKFQKLRSFLVWRFSLIYLMNFSSIFVFFRFDVQLMFGFKNKTLKRNYLDKLVKKYLEALKDAKQNMNVEEENV